MRTLTLALGLLVLGAPDPGEAAPADPAVIRARLEKVEALIRAGDPNTALAWLQGFGVSYPGSTEFHQRAMTLAIDHGDDETARRIANELLERDPGSAAARECLSQADDLLEKRSMPVGSLEQFEALALRREIDERGARILRALKQWYRQSGERLVLEASNQAALIEKLHHEGLLEWPEGCPLEGGSYAGSADDDALACKAAVERSLLVPPAPPLVPSDILERALARPSPITRKHARRLLIDADRSRSVLSAAAVQITGLTSAMQIEETLEDLDTALYALSCRKLPLPALSPEVLDFLRAGLSSQASSCRWMAAHSLHLLKAPVTMPAGLDRLLDPGARPIPASFDSEFLGEVLLRKPALTPEVVARARSGEHPQPRPTLIQALRKFKEARKNRAR